jgi:glycosyltransferase involved in cell wall biosynthesis
MRFLKEEYQGKVIWTLHDCWALTGHCAHFTYIGCDRWRTNCGDCPQRSIYPKSCWLDQSARNHTEKSILFTGLPNLTVVTVSQWLKGIVKQSYLKEYPVHCIYNGIDLKRFHPVPNRVKEELGIREKKMILLISNGWNTRKGFDKVLSTAMAAPEDWQFVMIGLSSKQIRKLPKNITGIQRIWDQNKLVEFYSAADVFYHPSVEETFGLVIAEAMACGTAAVVCNSTACPELIRDSSCGRVIQRTASPEEIVEILASAMKEKANQKKQLFSLRDSLQANLSLYGK